MEPDDDHATMREPTAPWPLRTYISLITLLTEVDRSQPIFYLGDHLYQLLTLRKRDAAAGKESEKHLESSYVIPLIVVARQPKF